MPRHLAIGKNILYGSVSINNAKTVNVTFKDEEGNLVFFQVAPRITITLVSATTAVAFKLADIKTGAVFSGFTIGFAAKVTVDMEWQATERDA